MYNLFNIIYILVAHYSYAAHSGNHWQTKYISKNYSLLPERPEHLTRETHRT